MGFLHVQSLPHTAVFSFFFSQYQDQDNVSDVECKACKVNTYQADDRIEWVNHDNEADCISCAAGLFAKQIANRLDQGCSTCPAGKQAGNISCETCQAGQISLSETDLKCVECNVGKYQNEPGLPSCIKCIPGQYQDQKGEMSCKECQQGRHDAGRVPARNASTVCEDCEYIFFFFSELIV